MTSAISALDEAVKEYLVYRGFTNTLKQFEQERKEDKDKGLKVNRIVDHILQCINRSDFISLQNYWVYLNKRFFSRLAHDSLMTVYRLETHILRLFLVSASRQGKHDVVRDFFEKMTDSLQDKKEWKDWFALPFTKNPDQHSSFQLYFTKEWSDAFSVTLHNFFSTLFACLPLPALLNFEAEHQKMQVLSTENHHLQMHLANTRQALADAESHVQRLEAKVSQQEAKLAHQVANQAAIKRSSAVIKTSKQGGKGSTSKKTPLAKKPLGKAMSLESHQSPTTPIEKQTSEPSVSQVPTTDDKLKRGKDASLKGIASAESNLECGLRSPGSDIHSEDPFPVPDGSSPFFPLKHDVYKSHSAPITHCKLSSNASHVASADTDGFLRVWDSSLCTTIATVEVKPSLLSLDWAPQSDHLVLLGSGNGVVQLYDCNTHRTHWTISSEQQYPRILSIACSNTGSTFAFSAASSIGTPHTSSSYLNRSYGLTSPGLPSSRFISNEMTHFQPAGPKPHEVYPGGVYVYDLKTQQQKCSLPFSNPVSTNCMAFNHNSSLLITGASDGMIRLFDVAQKEFLFGWRAHDYSDVFNVQFSSDETSVYSMGGDQRFCQWSINRTGDMMVEFNIHDKACQPSEGRLKGEYYPSTPQGNLFAFENEDKYVLTCAPDQAIVYQVHQGGKLSKMLSISGHSGPVTCVDWLHGSSVSTCITGSIDTSVHISSFLKNKG